MSNFSKRLITGLLGASIIVAGTLLSKYSFGIIFFLIMIFSSLEFIAITGLGKMSLSKKWILLLANGSAFILGYGIAIDLFPSVFRILGILPMFFLFSVGLWGRSAPDYKLSAILLSGHAYIGIPYMLLNYIYLHKADFWPSYVIAILFFVWANDIGAYFAGKRFGKTPLNKKVSPKKTWEGFFGGLLFTLLIAYSAFYLSGFEFMSRNLNLLQWLFLGLIVSMGSTFGDLIASSIKRTFDVKDFSSVLPGHGGFLDRFDGFVIAVVFAYAYLSLLGIIH